MKTLSRLAMKTVNKQAVRMSIKLNTKHMFEADFCLFDMTLCVNVVTLDCRCFHCFSFMFMSRTLSNSILCL